MRRTEKKSSTHVLLAQRQQHCGRQHMQLQQHQQMTLPAQGHDASMHGKTKRAKKKDKELTSHQIRLQRARARNMRKSAVLSSTQASPYAAAYTPSPHSTAKMEDTPLS